MSDKQKKTKDNSQEKLVFTRETLGVVLILFSTLCLVFLITGDSLMYPVGGVIQSFLLGTFGFFSYAVLIYAIIKGVTLLVDKNFGFSVKFKLLLTTTFVVMALLCQTISMREYSGLGYGEYISKAYMLGVEGNSTASGFITSLLSYCFSLLLTNVGSYVVLGVLTAVLGYGTVTVYLKESVQKGNGGKKFRSSVVKEGATATPDEPQIQGVRDYPIDVVSTGEVKPEQKLFVIDAEASAFKPVRKNGKDDNTQIKLEYTNGGLTVGSKVNSYGQSYSSEMQSKLDYIKQPAKLDLTNGFTSRVSGNRSQSVSATTVSDYIPPKPTIEENSEKTSPYGSFTESAQTPEIPIFEHNLTEDTAESRAQNFHRDYLEEFDNNQTLEPSFEENATTSTEQVFSAEPIVEEQDFSFTGRSSRETPFVEPTPEPTPEKPVERSNVFGFGREVGGEVEEQKPQTETPETNSRVLGGGRRGLLFNDNDSENDEQKPAYTSRVEADDNQASSRISASRNRFVQPEPVVEVEPEPEQKPAPPINREYFRPPLDLLKKYEQPLNAETEDHNGNLEIIRQTLEDFHIPSEPQGYIQGPSITRYEIRIPTGKGISVKKVLNYDEDLKMRLRSPNGIRIEAPIPGKDLVGIEVANKVKTTVGLRDVLELAAKTDKSKPGALTFALGKDIVGNAITDNLAKGPHYLVAGATGSGKSVCLNTMIVSLIMRYSPEDLRLVLIDPKSVEFTVYDHIPHLLIDEIITHPKKAIAVLSWAYEEMERRYKTFRDSGQFVVDIDSYNAEVASDTVPKLSRIVIIIDELADLMQTCKKDFESRICALAQKARSAGIHLVLATQRPSVDVITGTIKANLPSRIAFKVTNFNDSQTILAEAGAEKLLGNGDMLYKNSSMPDLGRYQGAFITAQEVNAVCTYIRENNQGYFDDQLQEYLDRAVKPAQEENHEAEGGSAEAGSDGASVLFLRSLWLAVTMGKISISALQRRYQIGYGRAGGLIDKMFRMGYISGDEGSKARQVFLTREQYVEKYGEPPAEEF